MSEWRPIESAPKDDETYFLAIMAPGKIPFVTSWDADDETFVTFNMQYESAIQKINGKPWRPTHWMPLPAPPEGS